MARPRRGAEPDPWAASGQAPFRARLRDLLRWAGYTSLQQLEAGAARRGTSMPVSTANRALNNDRLPTAEFVERVAVACSADVKRWSAARDALADRSYLRVARVDDAAPDTEAANQSDNVPDTCPYPGLAAFGLDHAQWFFGREKVTAEVLDLLLERLGGTGPLMIAGPSGTGKSSLLRAGLRSALSAGRLAGSRNWPQQVFTPTADPVGQLAAQISAHNHADPEVVTSALLSNPGHLADVLREIPSAEGDRRGADRVRAVLVVDQFEEVFTLCSDEQRRNVFISALCAASRADGVPPALVVLGMRADFYGRCATYPGLVEALRRGQVLLGPMNAAELRDAVEKPARVVGLELQSGLVDVVLGDLGVGDEAAGEPGYQPGALPLLAHALLATWQQRDGRTLTLAGYRLTGGITGAIAKTAERAYQQLDSDQQEIARTVLLRMIQLGDGSADTRRRVDCARLVEESEDPAGVTAVLDTLTNTRLVTRDAAAVEIVHEAVLRAWPRLRAWIDNDRAGLLLEQRLVEAAEAWDGEGRHDSDLYRGPRLAAVQERLDAADPTLPSPAPEFLHACVERERAEQQGVLRRARRLRQLVAVLSCLVLLAATTTALAVLSLKDIKRQRDVGVSREVADAAIALRVSDPDLAAQLALAAYRIKDTAEAQGALMTALVNLDPERRSDSGSAGAVQAVAFSHNGQLLVAASRDRFARVWAVGGSPSLAPPPIAYLEHPDQVRSAVFDPTDHVLATSGADGRVRLWSVEGLGQGNDPVKDIPGPTGARGPLAFNHDGAVLATGGGGTSGGTSGTAVRLWDVTDLTNPRMTAEFPAHRRDVFAVAFGKNGRTLATASADGTAKLWDITDRADPIELAAFDQYAGLVYAIAFSPDGHLLAIGSQDATATLWDVENPRAPRKMSVLGRHLGGVTGVAFSLDSRTLATASLDNAARLWDVSNPARAVELAVPLAGDADNLYSVAFHPDGHTLATSSYGQTVRLWETDVNRAAAQVCELAFPAISREEWDRYLPGRDYAPPCSRPAGLHRDGEDVRMQPRNTTLVATHSGKCVAIRKGVTVPGAPAYQFRCAGATAAAWDLQRAAAPSAPDGGAVYRIRNASTGMCLDSLTAERWVGGASMVVQRPCVDDAASQLWRFERVGQEADSTEGRFVNTQHGDCLNVNGAAVTDAAPIVRWQCGNDPNGIFQVSTDALDR